MRDRKTQERGEERRRKTDGFPMNVLHRLLMLMPLCKLACRYPPGRLSLPQSLLTHLPRETLTHTDTHTHIAQFSGGGQCGAQGHCYSHTHTHTYVHTHTHTCVHTHIYV